MINGKISAPNPILKLFVATKYLDENDKHVKSLLLEINEIIKLLTSIIKTMKADNE